MLLSKEISKLDDLDLQARESNGVILKEGMSTMCGRCASSFLKIMTLFSKYAASSANGLCLNCVRHRRRDNLKSYACRFKHKDTQYLGLHVAASHSRKSIVNGMINTLTDSLSQTLPLILSTLMTKTKQCFGAHQSPKSGFNDLGEHVRLWSQSDQFVRLENRAQEK